jgi:hypothetical protein
MTSSPVSTDDQVTPLVAAFVGPRWDSHYRRIWAEKGGRTGLRDSRGWNRAAALLTIPWLVYRRRFVAALCLSILLFVVGIVAFHGGIARLAFAAYWIGTTLAYGRFADGMVLRRAFRAATEALQRFGPGESAIRASAKAGGVSGIGSTVVGTLQLAFYVPLLFLMSMPLWGRYDIRFAGYKTQMISDLRSVGAAEEKIFVDSGRYTRNIDALFTPTFGANAPTFVVMTDTGFAVTVTHPGLPGMVCGLAVGAVNPVNPAAGEGEPVCK